MHVKIARRRAELAGLAFTGQADTVTGIDTWRYFYGNGLAVPESSLPLTSTARVIDDISPAAAFGTGLLDREKPLLHANLADAVTGGALDRTRPSFGAAAGTLITGHQPGHPYLDGGAGYGFFQVQFQVITEVRAGLGALAAAPLRAEYVAEHAVEYIAEPAESLGIRPSSGRSADAGMAELVVSSPFLLVAQDIVRFLGLLEFLLRLLVIRIAVRMVFHRQAAECLFYVRIGRIF